VYLYAFQVDRLRCVASISDRNFMDAEPCLASAHLQQVRVESCFDRELLVNEINKVTLYTRHVAELPDVAVSAVRESTSASE